MNDLHVNQQLIARRIDYRLPLVPDVLIIWITVCFLKLQKLGSKGGLHGG